MKAINLSPFLFVSLIVKGLNNPRAMVFISIPSTYTSPRFCTQNDLIFLLLLSPRLPTLQNLHSQFPICLRASIPKPQCRFSLQHFPPIEHIKVWSVKRSIGVQTTFFWHIFLFFLEMQIFWAPVGLLGNGLVTRCRRMDLDLFTNGRIKTNNVFFIKLEVNRVNLVDKQSKVRKR